MRVERYIWVAVVAVMGIAWLLTDCSRRVDIKDKEEEIVETRKALVLCYEAKSEVDTVIRWVEKRVKVYIRLVDSVRIIDTVYRDYDFYRYYNDTIEENDLKFWYDIITAGYLIGANFKYDVKVKEVIKNHIIWKDKLVYEPEKIRFFIRGGFGILEPSVFFGGMVSYKKWGISADYDLRKDVRFGVNYRLN